MATYDTHGGRHARVLSVEETIALLRACSYPYERAVVGLLVEAGLRPREVWATRGRPAARSGPGARQGRARALGGARPAAV